MSWLFIRKLICLHKGKIKFAYKEEQKLVLILIFPIVIRQSERVSEFSGILSVPELSTGNSELLSVTGMLPTVKTSEQKRPDKKKEKHSLVLVERNKDLCNYLVQILMKEYKIVSVCDVEAAFETVCEQCPDAVLASSVLTRISGEELAVRIKSDDRVAHIPVILLVKPGEDDRYIQRNADLYVWMPFAISSLKTEIAALIANREMIRKRYIRLALGGEASDPIDKEVESSEGDQEFIRQVRSLIEERMTDSGFKIGELSDCMNMSRSSFYNKIKEITGHAPADYVRNVRLNRALVLLMSRKYTVAEVADMTGFSDPKYFGIVFKKILWGLTDEVYKQFIDRQKTGKGATLPVFILLTNPVDWIERITLIFAIRKENCDAEGLQR